MTALWRLKGGAVWVKGMAKDGEGLTREEKKVMGENDVIRGKALVVSERCRGW